MSADPGSRPPLTVREASIEDAPALAELIAEFNGWQGDGQEIAARLAACAGLEIALLGCTPSGAVGFACLRMTPAIGTRTPRTLLTELYVREPFRRLGVGQALLERAEALTVERGGQALYLFTGQQNLTAQQFYERRGYQIRGLAYTKLLTE